MAKRRGYNSDQIRRAAGGAPPRRRPPQGGGQRRPAYNQDDYDPYLPQAAPLKKRRRWPVVLLVLLIVFSLGGAGIMWLYNYLDRVMDPGQLGIIQPVEDEYIPTGYSKRDVVHILIIGIDNEEGRNYGAGLGLTDMLLYCRYNIKDNQLNMLQIPRDSYVGENPPTNGTGKINALLISGPDKEHPINNLTGVVQSSFKLPIDYYIAMDMDAMKVIVDTFGGLNVYVPRDMAHGGSALSQGWHWMDGATAEFFVRNRYGPGFERGDIDRLDNQRHFYSALFRRFLNLTPGDIVKLLPVFEHYCNTNINVDGDMVSLAVAALNLTSEGVTFCKAPGATGEGLDPTGQGRNNYYLDMYGRGDEANPGLASLLNQYFRDPSQPVPASELLPQVSIPAEVALYPPNVQRMSEVQEPEGGAEVDVEPGAQA